MMVDEYSEDRNSIAHDAQFFLNVRLHSRVQQLSFYVTGVGSAWLGGYLL